MMEFQAKFLIENSPRNMMLLLTDSYLSRLHHVVHDVSMGKSCINAAEHFLLNDDKQMAQAQMSFLNVYKNKWSAYYSARRYEVFNRVVRTAS